MFSKLSTNARLTPSRDRRNGLFAPTCQLHKSFLGMGNDLMTGATNKNSPLNDFSYDEVVSDEEEPFEGSSSDREYVQSEEGNENGGQVYREDEQEGREVETEYEVQCNVALINNNREDNRTRKRKSKGQGDPSQWKRAKNAQARLQGIADIG